MWGGPKQFALTIVSQKQGKAAWWNLDNTLETLHHLRENLVIFGNPIKCEIFLKQILDIVWICFDEAWNLTTVLKIDFWNLSASWKINNPESLRS